MELSKQEKNLIKDLINKCLVDEFCDKTTKAVGLSILNKIKEDE